MTGICYSDTFEQRKIFCKDTSVDFGMGNERCRIITPMSGLFSPSCYNCKIPCRVENSFLKDLHQRTDEDGKN